MFASNRSATPKRFLWRRYLICPVLLGECQDVSLLFPEDFWVEHSECFVPFHELSCCDFCKTYYGGGWYNYHVSHFENVLFRILEKNFFSRRGEMQIQPFLFRLFLVLIREKLEGKRMLRVIPEEIEISE